jgi:PAS domain S-box-containing protein
MSPADIRGDLAGEGADLLEGDAEELYEDAPCGYLSTMPGGTILRVNRTFLSFTGYSKKELTGRRRFYDLLPPGSKIYYETHYAPLLQMQGSVREIALELIRADGARLPVLVNAVLKRDASGQPLLIRVTVLDASDRRRYERELLQARSEAEARAAAASALEHVIEGVILVDEDGRIRLLNPAAERILGAEVEEVRGLTLSAVSPDWAAVAPQIPVAMTDRGAGSAAVVPLSLAGETRWLAVAGETAPEGVVYTLRDVTEQRQLEELRDDIIAVVSHELRTPLTGVYGAAQTLISLGDQLQEQQRVQLIEMISEQSGRLTRIVEQVLLTQRLNTGSFSQRRAFDLSDTVERVLANVRAWPEERRVAAEVSAGVDAEGDPEMFEQALVNLLDNAIKYSPAETEVRVAVERVRASARVTVADDGPGIPPAEADRIFEKFYRLDPEQHGGVAGTGLGLYISKELIERMHGRIGLLPADRGATFHIDLPLHRTPR